jgi:hypothetical protein
VSGGGYADFNVDSIRAELYYDRDNTSYYLNPASTGTSLNVAGAIQLVDSKAIMWSGNNILSHNGTQTYIGDNSSSSTVTITGGNATFAGDILASSRVLGDYFVGTNYASYGYTVYKGYDNWNHFISIRGLANPGSTKAQSSIAGGHQTSFVEYAESNATTGWFFVGSAGTTYEQIAKITKSHSEFVGSLRAPLFYDKDNTSYYLNPSSTSIALKINGIIDQDFQSSNLNTAWTAPGSSYSQGFIVGRYQGGAANQPHHNDNANWFANIYSHSSSSGSTASYGLQLAGSNAGSGENSLSLRTVSNGSFSAWRRIYHEGHLPTLSELGALSSSDSQVVSSASGNRWGVNGFIATDGVMEVGKYIDFHNSDGDTSDYALRITSNGSTAAFSAGISSTTASFGTSATAPKFYDTSGTTYYLDLDNNGSVALKARGSILSYDSGGGNLYLRSEQSRTLYGSNTYENGVTVLTNQATTNYATFNTRGVTAAVLGNTPWGTGSASSGKDIFNIVRVNQAAYGPSTGKGSFRKVLNLRGNGNLYLGHVSNTGAVYATVYYDKASTTRYVDPGSTGDSIRVSGDVVAYYSSDKRLKNNIKPIDKALDKVNSISGVTFEWNEKSHKQTGKKDIGVIAQEVEEILPEVVETRTNGYKAVDYQKLTALLIESVKELTKEVQDLKSQINK